MFACGYSGVKVGAFFEKLAHFLAFVVKVGVVTAEASQSEKLPKFLSRLNGMSGGSENMCLVSGSLWRILNFEVFDCKVLWVVGKCEWNSVSFFVL